MTLNSNELASLNATCNNINVATDINGFNIEEQANKVINGTHGVHFYLGNTGNLIDTVYPINADGTYGDAKVAADFAIANNENYNEYMSRITSRRGFVYEDYNTVETYKGKAVQLIPLNVGVLFTARKLSSSLQYTPAIYNSIKRPITGGFVNNIFGSIFNIIDLKYALLTQQEVEANNRRFENLARAQLRNKLPFAIRNKKFSGIRQIIQNGATDPLITMTRKGPKLRIKVTNHLNTPQLMIVDNITNVTHTTYNLDTQEGFYGFVRDYFIHIKDNTLVAWTNKMLLIGNREDYGILKGFVNLHIPLFMNLFGLITMSCFYISLNFKILNDQINNSIPTLLLLYDEYPVNEWNRVDNITVRYKGENNFAAITNNGDIYTRRSLVNNLIFDTTQMDVDVVLQNINDVNVDKNAYGRALVKNNYVENNVEERVDVLWPH